MLTQVHFLLTYRCIFECDHCFLFSGPGAPDTTFSVSQIRQVLDEALKIGTVDMVYYEGGEAFLAYPLLLEAIELARTRGLAVGIVTNAFFATDDENAELWLRPLVNYGISDLSISDDAFHAGAAAVSAAQRAIKAARKLGLLVGSIAIDAPTVIDDDDSREKGAPVVGGDVLFRGRAVDKLLNDLPRRDYRQFTACLHEELVAPRRVHVDPQGNVHICQGVSMGNLWETPLSELVAAYDPTTHPITGPLVEGGPAQLAEAYDVPLEAGYVDACHLCYDVRSKLRPQFADSLAPPNVYGV